MATLLAAAVDCLAIDYKTRRQCQCAIDPFAADPTIVAADARSFRVAVEMAYSKLAKTDSPLDDWQPVG